MYIELHSIAVPTLLIREGTFIVLEDYEDVQIALFAQVEANIYKWVNLDGNRQLDDEWTRDEMMNDEVQFPESENWRILGEDESFTVYVD